MLVITVQFQSKFKCLRTRRANSVSVGLKPDRLKTSDELIFQLQCFHQEETDVPAQSGRCSLLFSLFCFTQDFKQLDNCYLYWGRDCFFHLLIQMLIFSKNAPGNSQHMTRSLGAQNVWPNISAANDLVKLTHKITITITTTVNALLSLSQLLPV